MEQFQASAGSKTMDLEAIDRDLRDLTIKFVRATETLNQLIALLARLLGRPLDVEHVAPRTGDVRHSQASSAALQRLFPGVEAVRIEEGLRRTITWMETRMPTTAQALSR